MNSHCHHGAFINCFILCCYSMQPTSCICLNQIKNVTIFQKLNRLQNAIIAQHRHNCD